MPIPHSFLKGLNNVVHNTRAKVYLLTRWFLQNIVIYRTTDYWHMPKSELHSPKTPDYAWGYA